ncbi:endonuclease V [Candidatus Woesearchaeota archaeon]|nr:endonuclease V [Candidatus Woesearchaeota archaeon]
MAHVSSLRDIQRAIAKQAVLEDQVPIDSIKKIAAFDCAQLKESLVCSVIVCDYPSMNVVERKYLVKRAPMPYVPGYLSFREGPLMLELYYKLESDPDILIVDGHGVAHPAGCGVATYLGVELHKPTFGVANSLTFGERQEDNILIDGQVVGKVIKTKEHAKELCITAGHLIAGETAAQIALKCVVPPHKLPEPLHIAHRFAEKTRDRIVEESMIKKVDV